jgi:hypothetical protein
MCVTLAAFGAIDILKEEDRRRGETIGTMIEGLRMAGKDDILALGYTFAGLVYRTEEDRHWLKRRFAIFQDILEDSWSYKEIVQKGLDQGLDQGFQKGLQNGIGQGELMTARQFLARIVEKHFPPLLLLAQQKAAQLKTIDKLNRVIDSLLDVQTLEQARQVLEEQDL